MSFDLYDELQRLGAPELPDDLFYRVKIKEEAWTGRVLHLQIRECRQNFFRLSRTIAHDEIHLEDREFEDGKIRLNDGWNWELQSWELQQGGPRLVTMTKFVAIRLRMLYEDVNVSRAVADNKKRAINDLRQLVGDHP